MTGLAVPTYVIDLPHGGGKVPLQPNYVLSQTADELILRNYQGHVFEYRNPGSLAAPVPVPVKVSRRNSTRNVDSKQLALLPVLKGDEVASK